jgi:hypothetical protein
MQKPRRTVVDGIETISITRQLATRAVLMLHGLALSVMTGEAEW